MTLEARSLRFGYGDDPILKDLDITIPEGRITALVGANGSGKTTILKSLARILKPSEGAVYLDGEAIAQMSTKAVARKVAVLPQNPDAPGGLLVRELVGYGRYPWQKGFATASAADKAAVTEALRLTNLEDLAERPVGTLSGGQRQRAWIAMALAQNSATMLLDEPTTFLDMAHQLEVLSLLKALNAERGTTIVMVVHDLNHALRYADHMIAIQSGTIVAQGAPAEALTPEVLHQTFGVAADLITDPRSGALICVPYALAGTVA